MRTETGKGQQALFGIRSRHHNISFFRVISFEMRRYFW